MQRRDFFKTMLPLGMYPLMPRFPFGKAAATHPALFNPCDVTDRVLVVVFLAGGNDIINTMVPLNQLSEYHNLRPTLGLPDTSLIHLDNTLPSVRQLGLHPRLTGLKALYDEGKMSVVQGVGYSDPNRSHFKSLDNWLTGSGGGIQDNETGWAGRFLSNRYPGYNGQPFLGEPDPLGVLLGKMNSTGFHTLDEHRLDVNLSGQDLSGFYTLISTINGAPIENIPNSEYGEMLRHIEAIGLSANVYAQRISEVFNNGSNSSTVYPDTPLGNQLKTVARMLKGGSRTKIFMATETGFDTHVQMVNTMNTTEGLHANLLGGVGDSLKAFQDDLAALTLDDKVMTVVFSEFGRKVVENASIGLDHGTLSSMFVIGKAARGSVIGGNLNLSDLDGPGAINATQLQNDYRRVFATMAQDWLGANNNALTHSFIDETVYLPKIPLIDTTNTVPASCYYTPIQPPACACFNLKMMLEGFYDANTLTMRDDLKQANLLPLSQPYNVAPYNYGGTEMVVTFPDDTVDWVLLELRDANDFKTVVDRKAMLVRRDGFVMDVNGNLGVEFVGVPQGEYYLAVKHRNHLAILSAETINTQDTNFTYNFTLSADQAFGGQQLKKIGTTWVMIAGDLDGNHAVNSGDYNLWTAQNGQDSLYLSGDINADLKVDSLDYGLWDSNRSKLGALK